MKTLKELRADWVRGAQITNKKLTTESRQKAAKKGWRDRKRRLNAEGK